MSLFKKKLTEQEMASLFVIYLTKEAQDAWPAINKSLKESFKEKFVAVKDDMTASFDLALAAIAQDLQAVKNLFPKDQAERIERWVYKSLSDMEDWGEYAADEVKKYSETFQKDVENMESPLSAIPARLLYRWLGSNQRNFEVEINGKKTGVIDPILIAMLTSILVAFAGTWKRVLLKDDVELVEGDLPFDEKSLGLKDYVPEQVNNKPDGTIEYYDESGNKKEKWLPPEQLKELLKKGGAKRLYKVLVKGPWDGVKETLWELSGDTVQKFVDENDFAYAICAYEKGEPEYTLTKKKIWGRMDEVEKIIMNPDLSEDERIEEIKKITKD